MTSQGFPTTSNLPPHTKSGTLDEAFSSSDNALNFVRLLLAALVVLGHAFPLGGFETFQLGPAVHGGWHGTAVEGFFVISGYLIFASALRMPLLPYFWRRFLRIYPGYVCAIALTAFVFGPLGTALGAEWDLPGAVRFFLKSLTLKSGDLPVEADVPWPATWNGSLWTLFYEALAYIGAGIIASIPFIRRHTRGFAIVAVATLSALYLFLPSEVLLSMLPERLAVLAENALRLWTYFAWGMLAYAFADRIRPRLWATLVAGALAIALLTFPALGAFQPLLLPALTYVVLAAGALIPWRIGAKNDLSYGMYVYAFPVQQLLILGGIAHFGYWVTSLACLILTLPLAWLSWTLVEQPAMGYKSLVPAKPRA